MILEGIYARFLEGGTVGTGFEATGAQAVSLAHAGLAVADRVARSPALRASYAAGQRGTPDRTRTCASSFGG